jgi:hypothetical protein
MMIDFRMCTATMLSFSASYDSRSRSPRRLLTHLGSHQLRNREQGRTGTFVVYTPPDIAIYFGAFKTGQDEGDVPKAAPIVALSAYYSTVLHGLALQTRDGASRNTLTQVVQFAMVDWKRMVSRPV